MLGCESGRVESGEQPVGVGLPKPGKQQGKKPNQNNNNNQATKNSNIKQLAVIAQNICSCGDYWKKMEIWKVVSLELTPPKN